MAGINPRWCRGVDEHLPKPKDQEQDVAMADAASDGTPHGGQEQDSQPDQKLLPNLDALGPGQQEEQQLEDPANIIQMQWDVPLTSKDRRTSATLKDWDSF